MHRGRTVVNRAVGPATTDFEALDDLWPLPPAELPRQWVLAEDVEVLPDVWPHRSTAGWHLAAHPDTQVCDLRARDGTPLGWVVEPLAHLLGTGGAIPDTEVVLPVSGDADTGDIERALYGRDAQGHSNGDGLEGNWAAIVSSGTAADPIRRVYLGAIHSVVYDPERRVVSTTHNLVQQVQRSIELSRAFDPLATNAYYTFGLTPFVGLRRLLPNHYLDLDSFRPVRHWPPAALRPLPSGEGGAAAIVAQSQRLVAAVTTRHPRLRVFLSAGRDSRAVLALLRPFVEAGGDVVVTTSVGRDAASRTDVQTARRLARVTGLPHEVRRRRPHDPNQSDVLKAFVRIGESKSGPILSAPGVTDDAARRSDGRFVLAGMAGETGRAFFWQDSWDAGCQVTPELLAQRTGSPLIRPVLEAAAAWRDDLPPGMSAADVLDLLYVEQRLGCWESSTRYLFPGRPLVASPMATAHNIEVMLRLPEPYRAAGLVQRDMVAHSWPGLLREPFNEARGVLALEQRVRRRLRPLRRRLGPRWPIRRGRRKLTGG